MRSHKHTWHSAPDRERLKKAVHFTTTPHGLVTRTHKRRFPSEPSDGTHRATLKRSVIRRDQRPRDLATHLWRVLTLVAEVGTPWVLFSGINFDVAVAAGVGPGDRIGRKILFILSAAAYLPIDNGVVYSIKVHLSEIGG